MYQGDDADESGGWVVHATQAFEQQGVVSGVSGVIPCVARRTDAGRAVECVDFQAGIICEKIAIGVLSIGDGFLDGIGFEGVAGLIWWGDEFRKRAHVEIRRGQLKLAQLYA